MGYNEYTQNHMRGGESKIIPAVIKTYNGGLINTVLKGV